MSVLIKGMKMPRNCLECMTSDLRTVIACAEWTEISAGEREIYRSLSCPLVELPAKHGDLIDRKALNDAVSKWLPRDPCGYEYKERPFETDICVSMLMEIDEQDIVIEAEDG